MNRVKYNPQSFGDKVFKRGDSRKVKERDKYERIGLERFKNQVASNMVSSSSGKPIKTREDRERAIKEAKAEMNDRALDNAYQDAEYLYSKYSSNAHKRGKDLTDDDIKKMKREYSQEYNEGDAFVNAVFDAVEKQMEEYTNDHTVKTKEQEEKEKQESEKKKKE